MKNKNQFCCDLTTGSIEEQNEFKRLFNKATKNGAWKYRLNFYGMDGKRPLLFRFKNEMIEEYESIDIIPVSEAIKILKEMVGEQETKKNFNGLLPCPFCGSNELLLFAQPSKDRRLTWNTIVHVSSVPCGISMIHEDVEQLKKDWNKRESNP